MATRMGIRTNDLPRHSKPQKPHVIEDISYSKDIIVCRCEWRGTVAGYTEHRREIGLTLRSGR